LEVNKEDTTYAYEKKIKWTIEEKNGRSGGWGATHVVSFGEIPISDYELQRHLQMEGQVSGNWCVLYKLAGRFHNN
jgi:hypothetical protein